MTLINSKLSPAQFELVQASVQLIEVGRQPSPAEVVAGLAVPEAMLGLLAERLNAQREGRRRIYRPTLEQLVGMAGSIAKVLNEFDGELTGIFKSRAKPRRPVVLRRP